MLKQAFMSIVERLLSSICGVAFCSEYPLLEVPLYIALIVIACIVWPLVFTPMSKLERCMANLPAYDEFLSLNCSWKAVCGQIAGVDLLTFSSRQRRKSVAQHSTPPPLHECISEVVQNVQVDGPITNFLLVTVRHGIGVKATLSLLVCFQASKTSPQII